MLYLSVLSYERLACVMVKANGDRSTRHRRRMDDDSNLTISTFKIIVSVCIYNFLETAYRKH